MSVDFVYVGDVCKIVEVVVEYLIKVGVDNVEVIEILGYFIVFGEKIVDVVKFIVMVYGYYDV